MKDYPKQQVKVFISSKCGDEYTSIRNKLYKKISKNAMLCAYCFEHEPASSLNIFDSYMQPLKSSDYVILLVDNKYDITDATYNEYKSAVEHNKKIICVIAHVEKKKKTKIESELQRTGRCKYFSVDKFGDMVNHAYASLIIDIYSRARKPDKKTKMPTFTQENIAANRIPDIVLHNNGVKRVYSYKDNKSPIEQILDSEAYKDKNVFLTGVGGRGKTFSLLEYFHKNREAMGGRLCIYVDLKMLDVRDHDEAIRKCIEKTYGLTLSDIPLKATVLLDGINEVAYGLRKNREFGSSYIASEIKFLLNAPFRLVLCSRNENISITNSFDNELSAYDFLYCSIESLRDEQVESVISQSKRAAHILKNNQMLSLYNTLLSRGIKIDETVLSGGVILDKYMDEYMRKKARSYLNNCDDDDATLQQIESADEIINNLYRKLSKRSLSYSIPTTFFSEESHLIDHLGILIKTNSNYIWADEIYRIYALMDIQKFLIVQSMSILESMNNNNQSIDEEQFEWIVCLVANCSSFIDTFRKKIMEGEVEYPICIMYETIQYIGEYMLHHNRQALTAFLNLKPNDEGFEKYQSIMFYLLYQNFSDFIDIPLEFCDFIEGGLFAMCEALHNIYFHPSVKRIDSFAFYECTNLREVIFNEKVETIPQYAFAKCTSLAEIEVPANVQHIEDSAFCGCTKLSKIKIGNNVRTIKSEAFMKCESLRKIYIPKSVRFVGKNVFEKCLNLTDVYCEAEKCPSEWDENWLCCNAKVHWGVQR